MAATSYTTLPSSSYVGLGSQGDLYHSANYGGYDTGIGSIASHPYQYETPSFSTHLTNNPHQSSYANDFLQSTHANGVYSTQQPQYYPTDRYAEQPTYNQENDYTNSQIKNYNNDRSTLSNNIDGNYAAPLINTKEPPHKQTIDNHHVESNNQHQTLYADTTQHHPPVPTDNQHHQSQAPPAQPNRIRSDNASNHPPPPPKQQQQQRHQSQPPAKSNPVRSEHKNSNHPSKQSPPARHRSPSTNRNDQPSATTTKTNNPPPEMKTTKSTQMRAAAIKQKGESREQKHKDGNFPGTKKKTTPPKVQQHPPTDDDQSEKKQVKRDKKQSHSVPKQRKSRRDDYQTEDNNSSADDDHPTRSKSKKRTVFPESHHERDILLPPVRRGRGPPFYDPAYDYPYPAGHLPRGRHPYYDDYPSYGPYPHPGRYDYRHRHLYEDAYDAPPYVASYHDPYDGFFDYEKRKGKSKPKKHKEKKETPVDQDDHEGITGNETERDDDTKSQQSKKSKNHKHLNKDDENEENTRQHWPHNYYGEPYYDGRDMLEIWRQERNDYLKKKFKPTIHDVLYSQQWMKSDSYLENQRRRALRDTQGYYFPYRKYTLKDYKDLQKSEAQNNPYASIVETPLNRKERAQKRHEYGSQIERQAADISVGQNKTPRDVPPKKPWHVTHGDIHDPEKLSKRERALEYSKVQVVKHLPHKAPKKRSGDSDPTEQYVNSLFPQANHDGEGSINGRDNQSSDEDDQ